MSLKPLTVYGHWGAPNPWKVAMVLAELNIPYDWKLVEFNEVKNPQYLQVNPNGRLPGIEDPNTGITLWESGAIILYLIDKYDKTGRLSYPGQPEDWLTKQWLFFQVSGQGPYFGQATWFARFHAEKLPSAIDRYVNEIDRVTKVLNTALQGKDWLVGDKCTYADLSFVTWASVAKGLLLQLGKLDLLDKYPDYLRWMKALEDRSVVKKLNEEIRAGRKANGLE